MQESVQARGTRSPSMPRRMRLRLLLLAVAVVAMPFGLWSLLPVGSHADQTPRQIQRKIDRKQSAIGSHRARERVLTTDISRQTRVINGLQSDITRLSDRQQRLQEMQ